MSDVADLSSSTELALAAYADLAKGERVDDTNIPALTLASDLQASLTQALNFAKRYPTVVASYNELHGTGFQPTVLANTAGAPGARDS